MIKLLLKKGANVTITDNDRYTALYATSINRHIEVAKLLIEKGADITVINSVG